MYSFSSLPLFLCFSPCLLLHSFSYASIYPFIHPSVRQSMLFSVNQSINHPYFSSHLPTCLSPIISLASIQSIHPSVRPSVRPPALPSIHPSIHLPVYLATYLSCSCFVLLYLHISLFLHISVAFVLSHVMYKSKFARDVCSHTALPSFPKQWLWENKLPLRYSSAAGRQHNRHLYWHLYTGIRSPWKHRTTLAIVVNLGSGLRCSCLKNKMLCLLDGRLVGKNGRLKPPAPPI